MIWLFWFYVKHLKIALRTPNYSLPTQEYLADRWPSYRSLVIVLLLHKIIGLGVFCVVAAGYLVVKWLTVALG
jgi:hypothetical protein